MKNNKELDMLNSIGLWLCKQMVDTNADTLTYTITGFHDKKKNYGDYELTVKKLSTPPAEEEKK